MRTIEDVKSILNEFIETGDIFWNSIIDSSLEPYSENGFTSVKYSNNGNINITISCYAENGRYVKIRLYLSHTTELKTCTVMTGLIENEEKDDFRESSKEMKRAKCLELYNEGKGLSFKEISLRLGVSAPTVSRYVKGVK